LTHGDYLLVRTVQFNASQHNAGTAPTDQGADPPTNKTAHPATKTAKRTVFPITVSAKPTSGAAFKHFFTRWVLFIKLWRQNYQYSQDIIKITIRNMLFSF
jgi:hypothetical protein